MSNALLLILIPHSFLVVTCDTFYYNFSPKFIVHVVKMTICRNDQTKVISSYRLYCHLIWPIILCFVLERLCVCLAGPALTTRQTRHLPSTSKQEGLHAEFYN